MQPNTSLARDVMVFPSLDYCVLYHFPWVKKLEFRVGVGEWWVRSQGSGVSSQGSVVKSWSSELELESGMYLFYMFYTAEEVGVGD